MMKEKYHFIGIGGIGMSALARIALQKKAEVSGSDLSSSVLIEKLSADGANITVGHSADAVTADKVVIYSTDIQKGNPELVAATILKCSLLHRSDFLAHLMKGFKSLAVTGTHGKTTVSALLSSVLLDSGCEPAFAIGGVLKARQTNADHGAGKYFVAEADESDGSFLKYSPYGAIVTNIGSDHLDYYKNDKALDEAFGCFFAQVGSYEHLFWCGDDARLVALHPPGSPYGFGKECSLRAVRYRQEGWHLFIDITFEGVQYADVEVALIGKHNALNALAVFGLALRLGIPEAAIRQGLKDFQGVGRRCDHKGSVHGVTVMDDYAHHPTEIRTTLKAIHKACGEKRLIVAFQPHRYSRTRDCAKEFARAFESADLVLITDVYGSGEAPIPGISYQTILDEVDKVSNVPIRHVPRGELVSTLCQEVLADDVVITMGAGDVTKIGPEFLAALEKKAPRKLVVGLIAGGRSTEHEVSLSSVRTIDQALDRSCYDVKRFGITRSGKWIAGEDPFAKLDEISRKKAVDDSGSVLSPQILEEFNKCDVFIPVLHGPWGEDGTVQGFLEVMGKAYVGCDCASAAISMNKALAKHLFVSHGIATSPFVDFVLAQWEEEPEVIVAGIVKKLKFPVYVKAVHHGSSIGVEKVTSLEKLSETIERIFTYDMHLLVEEEVFGREVEFAVHGNDEIKVTPPSELLKESQQMVTYEAKYGPNSVPKIVKADLPVSVIDEGRAVIAKTYRAVGCQGLARIDCFLDENGKYWVNEVNPLPGFTPQSLYPLMCQAQGYTLQALMKRLLLLGMQRKRSQDKHIAVKYEPPR